MCMLLSGSNALPLKTPPPLSRTCRISVPMKCWVPPLRALACALADALSTTAQKLPPSQRATRTRVVCLVLVQWPSILACAAAGVAASDSASAAVMIALVMPSRILRLFGHRPFSSGGLMLHCGRNRALSLPLDERRSVKVPAFRDDFDVPRVAL